MNTTERKYISDQELAAFWSIASPAIQMAIDLSVLTGLGESEVIELAWIDVYETTIDIRRTKTCRQINVPISDDIETVLLRAFRRKPSLPRWFVLRQSNGEPFTSEHFRAQWKKLMIIWCALGHRAFSFRDIKRRITPPP